jgi:hypothetical protein
VFSAGLASIRIGAYKSRAGIDRYLFKNKREPPIAPLRSRGCRATVTSGKQNSGRNYFSLPLAQKSEKKMRRNAIWCTITPPKT